MKVKSFLKVFTPRNLKDLAAAQAAITRNWFGASMLAFSLL